MKPQTLVRTALAFVSLLSVIGTSPQAALAAPPTPTKACSVAYPKLPANDVVAAVEQSDAAQLDAVLVSSDLLANSEFATVTDLTCLDGKNTIRAIVIPYTNLGADSRQAYIGIVSGTWDGKAVSEAIAVYDKDLTQVYVANGAEISAESRDVWAASLPVRIDAVLGPTPQLVSVADVTEARLVGPAVSVRSSAKAAGLAQPLMVTCTGASGTQTAYTALGFVAYRFSMTKNFCYSGAAWGITNISVSTGISDVDPMFYYNGVVSSWDSWASNGTYHTSFRQGRFDNCIPIWGCIGASYPSVTITAIYTGGNIVSTGW